MSEDVLLHVEFWGGPLDGRCGPWLFSLESFLPWCDGGTVRSSTSNEILGRYRFADGGEHGYLRLRWVKDV